MIDDYIIYNVMKFKLLTLSIVTLLSVTIFSILSSNSFAFFKEQQEKLFIEDEVIVKVLDGERYKTIGDVVNLFNYNNLDYVMYYKDDNTFYVLNNNYDKMLKLATENGEIIDQTIYGYDYKQLNLDSDNIEVFIAVDGMTEDELVNLFIDENTGYTDGTIAQFSQRYEGMLSMQLYAVFIILIIVVNYMYFSLFLQTQKEKIGIQKLLGFTTDSITKKYVTEIFIYYAISVIFVYLFNYRYINFMFSQSYVFQDIINIIIIYIVSIIATVFVCGAIISYYVNRLSTVKFLREVSYE